MIGSSPPPPPTMRTRPTTQALLGPRCPASAIHLQPPTPKVTHAHFSDSLTRRHQTTLRPSKLQNAKLLIPTHAWSPVYTRAHTNACTQLSPHMLGQVSTCPQSSSSSLSPFPGTIWEWLRTYHTRWTQGRGGRKQLFTHRHQPCNTSLLVLGGQREVKMGDRGIG